MPRFFFHLSDGTVSLDPEGVELSGEAEACEEAVRYLGELLHYDAQPDLANGHPLNLSVTDEAGDPLFRLEVRAIKS